MAAPIDAYRHCDQAILVAVLGLIVNGISVVILRDRQPHHEGTASHRHDHNLLAAYLHVLADALTSLLAIFALLAGKYLGCNWLDPAMGIVGAVLVPAGLPFEPAAKISQMTSLGEPA